MTRCFRDGWTCSKATWRCNLDCDQTIQNYWYGFLRYCRVLVEAYLICASGRERKPVAFGRSRNGLDPFHFPPRKRNQSRTNQVDRHRGGHKTAASACLAMQWSPGQSLSNSLAVAKGQTKRELPQEVFFIFFFFSEIFVSIILYWPLSCCLPKPKKMKHCHPYEPEYAVLYRLKTIFQAMVRLLLKRYMFICQFCSLLTIMDLLSMR